MSDSSRPPPPPLVFCHQTRANLLLLRLLEGGTSSNPFDHGTSVPDGLKVSLPPRVLKSPHTVGLDAAHDEVLRLKSQTEYFKHHTCYYSVLNTPRTQFQCWHEYLNTDLCWCGYSS